MIPTQKRDLGQLRVSNASEVMFQFRQTEVKQKNVVDPSNDDP